MELGKSAPKRGFLTLGHGMKRESILCIFKGWRPGNRLANIISEERHRSCVWKCRYKGEMSLEMGLTMNQPAGISFLLGLRLYCAFTVPLNCKVMLCEYGPSPSLPNHYNECLDVLKEGVGMKANQGICHRG